MQVICCKKYPKNTTNYTQKVVGMFDRNPRFQRFVSFGLQGLDYRYEDDDDVDEDDFGVRRWLPPPHYWTGDHLHLSAPMAHAKESEAETNARLLKEMRKGKEKAEKKKLKKQNQKRKKQLEKEKQNPLKAEEGKGESQQSKAEDTKPVAGKPKDDANSSVKKSTSAQDTESSEGESTGEDSDTENDPFESEELDMTSTFVTKAALIAKRKMEQRPKPERKEKKVPVKESKTVPDRTNEEQEVEHKDFAACSIPTFEDHLKISTELAVIGNRFASSGDFKMAVKYFTDAIKYNPTEFKLFGNRSFCFEKMQEYEKALTDAELCVNLCPGWVKGLFRKGRALAGLKRYMEAAQSFGEVLKLDGSYAEAAQELMRVKITQLMECGFTREQSSNALIIHGTVEEALAVLSNLNHRQGAFQSATVPGAQIVNNTGVSRMLSANTYPPVAAYPPQSHSALNNKPIGPGQNMSNFQSQHKPVPHQAMKLSHENSRSPMELFPVWVGNLIHPVPDSVITNVFSKAGAVYSVKVLPNKRCAFVNFTKQEHCDEAIRRFHGYDLEGMKIAVRYPDRIPPGMGISRSALKSDDLQNENSRQNGYGSLRPVYPHRPVPEH